MITICESPLQNAEQIQNILEQNGLGHKTEGCWCEDVNTGQNYVVLEPIGEATKFCRQLFEIGVLWIEGGVQ